MQLFFIAHTDEENFDLFVWADDRAQAVLLWNDYYGFIDYDAKRDEVKPDKVFTVPTAPTTTLPNALQWGEHIKEVE